MKIKIKVMRKHIEEGDRMEPESCPIALACREQVRAARIGKWEVGSSQVKDCHGEIVFRLTQPCQDFVYDFDHSRDVKPLSFTITLPDKKEQA